MRHSVQICLWTGAGVFILSVLMLSLSIIAFVGLGLGVSLWFTRWGAPERITHSIAISWGIIAYLAYLAYIAHQSLPTKTSTPLPTG